MLGQETYWTVVPDLLQTHYAATGTGVDRVRCRAIPPVGHPPYSSLCSTAFTYSKTGVVRSPCRKYIDITVLDTQEFPEGTFVKDVDILAAIAAALRPCARAWADGKNVYGLLKLRT